MSLDVLLLDTNPSRAAMIMVTLQLAGHDVVVRPDTGEDLIFAGASAAPDVLIIGTDSYRVDLNPRIAALMEMQPCPVVVFNADGHTDEVNEAIEAGVSGYVAQEFQPERLETIVNAAIAHFNDRGWWSEEAA